MLLSPQKSTVDCEGTVLHKWACSHAQLQPERARVTFASRIQKAGQEKSLAS